MKKKIDEIPLDEFQTDKDDIALEKAIKAYDRALKKKKKKGHAGDFTEQPQ